MKLSRAHLTTNYIAGYSEGKGCCYNEGIALNSNDREICGKVYAVDLSRVSEVSLTEKFVPKAFLKTQPPVTGKADTYVCNKDCKVNLRILSVLYCAAE